MKYLYYWRPGETFNDIVTQMMLLTNWNRRMVHKMYNAFVYKKILYCICV